MKPPRGKKGTYATPSSASRSMSLSSWRWARLYMFCTHAIGAVLCASVTCSSVALLIPRWRIRPCCWSSTSVSNASASEPGWGTFGVAESEVDQVEDVEAEGLEVVVDLAAQIFGSAGCRPAALFVAGRAHLGQDVQRLGIGVQCLADQLVGDARPVGVAGVDVCDTEGDRFTQHGQGTLAIGGRPHDPRAGQLHGAVAEPGDGQVTQNPGAAGKGQGGCAHLVAFRRALGGWRLLPPCISMGEELPVGK